MKKTRNLFMSDIFQQPYTNGVPGAGNRFKVSVYESLDYTQSNPSYFKIKRRMPKRPKIYRGKDQAKLKNSARIYVLWAKRFGEWQAIKRSDVGGPFLKRSRQPFLNYHHVDDTRTIGSNKYRLVADVVSSSQAVANGLTLVPSSDSELDVLGTIGISRSLPTNPLVDMGQWLVELRDLPQLFDPFKWKDRLKVFTRHRIKNPKAWKSLAEGGSGEYLNVSFGWLPFLSDIDSFFKISDNLNKRAATFARNSGKHIRRRRTLIDTSSTTNASTSGAGPWPSLFVGLNMLSAGVTDTDITTSRKVTFAGAFTYYLPPLDNDISHRIKRYSAFANHLFGLRLDIDLLWKVTPWTWAADWIFDSGAIVRNWNAFANQGLVMHYGYVMEEKKKISAYTLRGVRFSNSSFPPATTDFNVEKCLSRRRATPYGFGLNPASFTPFQNGIIAALGINRVAR